MTLASFRLMALKAYVPKRESHSFRGPSLSMSDVYFPHLVHTFVPSAEEHTRILTILESGQPIFQKVADDATSIRVANPDETDAESIRDLPILKGMDNDSRSIYTLIGRNATQISAQPLTDRRRRDKADMAAPYSSNIGQVSSTAEAKFIESLDNIRSKMRAPASAVGVLSVKGSSVYVRGVRKHDCPTPVTQLDRFGVNSLTTLVMSTLLARLIE